MRKRFLFAVLVFGAGAFLFWRFGYKAPAEENFPSLYPASAFLPALEKTKGAPLAANATGLIVPHHLLAADLIAQAFFSVSKNVYKTIVVISPDHYNGGDTKISVALRDFETPFGVVPTNRDLAARLMDGRVISSSDLFYREHGIQAELPFIKYYFPQSAIVAVALRSDATRDDADLLLARLKEIIGTSTLVVQSTDFSHYLGRAEADRRDDQSLAIIRSGVADAAFGLKQPDNIDSIGALYSQMAFQRALGASPFLMAHANSADYAHTEVASTTSYFTYVYVKE